MRRPDIDFSDVGPHWAPNTEAAHLINAANLVPAYVEPFLLKVMRQAKRRLDPAGDADLLADLDIFNGQEAQHTRMHAAAFRVVRDRYPGVVEYEDAYRASYDRFLAGKSLRFLLAYADGFEAYASATAPAWVDGALDPLFAGGDQRSLDVWKWHLAEEYEHRSVVFSVYERLYGRPAWRAWLYRAAMYVYTQVHLGWFTARLYRYLLARDRAGMSARERIASRRRTRAVAVHAGRAFLRDMLRPLSPVYDPARVPPPTRLEETLARYDAP